jgi:hypothetical protein
MSPTAEIYLTNVRMDNDNDSLPNTHNTYIHYLTTLHEAYVGRCLHNTYDSRFNPEWVAGISKILF